MVRAADPRRAALVLQRLDSPSAAADAVAQRAQQIAPPPEPRREQPLTAYQQVEAFFLRQMLEQMLPRDQGVFGAGQSDDLWRSLMAEKMGETLARSGRIGIAAQLAQKAGGTA